MGLLKTEKERDGWPADPPLEKTGAGGPWARRGAPPRVQAVANSLCRGGRPQQTLLAISMELGGK